MWQLSIVSPLILASFCLGAYQQANRPNVDNNNNDRLKTVLAESGDVVSPQDRECIPYYQCSKDGTFTESGEGRLDVRIADGKSGPLRKFCTEAGYCVDHGYTCCRYASVSNVAHDISPSPPPVHNNLCGQSNVIDLAVRILGKDNESKFGEFPWLTLISAKSHNYEDQYNSNGKPRRCTGALIHERVVLTAAHCIDDQFHSAILDPSPLMVRAGEYDVRSTTEVYPHQDRDVAKVIIHPEFNATSVANDFAILILDTPVNPTKNVGIVCLPTSSDNFDRHHCFVSGWGQNSSGSKVSNEPIPKKTQVPLVSNRKCQRTYRKHGPDRWFVLDTSFRCAGGEAGADACQGDGGAPLVCAAKNDNYRYVQVGIVAFGLGCGNEGIPGVYADVVGAQEWIDEVVSDNHLDTRVYEYSP